MSTTTRRFAMAALALFLGECAAASFGPPPASAESLLESIFGIFVVPPPPASPAGPPEIGSGPLRIIITPRLSRAPSGNAGYCVRLCDGRYFPLPRLKSSNMMPTEYCKALCPTGQTMVFWGAPIAEARTSTGSRYSDLETAFNYRKRLQPECTCNGADSFGTAAISIAADITLQPGDIVVTENGVRVFVGAAGGPHKAEDFGLLSESVSISADQIEALKKIEVTLKDPLTQRPIEFRTRVILGTPTLSSRGFLPVNGEK